MAAENDRNRRDEAETPGPIRQVGPEGAASPEPASTADRDQPSALGGDVATRSRVERDEEDREGGERP